MNKKFILVLLTTMLLSSFSSVFAYNVTELNNRLRACTPTNDFNAGGSTYYQITGLMGSVCVFKILYNNPRKSDLICKVPPDRMYDMISLNPLVVQGARNKYCVMSLRSFNNQKKVYY